MKARNWLMLLLAVALPTQAALERAAFRAMGTLVEVSVRDEDPETRRAGIDTARRLFERYGREWYAWNEDSELAHVNRALAAGRTASASRSLIALLREARRLWCLSEGRFNPAIGGLVEAWDFQRPPPYETPAPEAAIIERWRRQAPSPADLRLTDTTIASSNSAVQLDLGAIGKGAVIDRALAAMRAAGIEHAMINAGGDLAVIGTARGRHWRAAIRDPESGLLATVALEPGQALFTSGNSERFRVGSEGQRLGHLLDPRTGRPARGVMQASVIADSATRADAAATALLIADDENWRKLAASLGVTHVLRVTDEHVLQVDKRFAAQLDVLNASPEIVARALPASSALGCR